jgi:histidine ammonia-lyase
VGDDLLTAARAAGVMHTEHGRASERQHRAGGIAAALGTGAGGPAVEIGGPQLSVDAVDAVARLGRRAVLPAGARARVERCHTFVQELVRSGTPVYGLTTGCGPLAAHAVSPGMREQFQRNLVRSHATSLGTPHPTAFVRAAMLVRAHVLALGHSGVAPATIDGLLAMLDAGIHPIVREVGSVGASGDLVELAEVALALLGEGEVEVGGRPAPAASALRDASIAPLVPAHREGLALINGTSFHTGAAAVLVTRAQRVARAAIAAAAMSFEALRGQLEALDPVLHVLRPHPGHAAVNDLVVRLVRGSTLVDGGGSPADRQDAYTLRCIPQVLGAALDELAGAGRVVETELGSVSDNPLFLPEQGRVIHGGNFHGQPVAMALDRLKTAIVEIGVAAERRIARLLDPALNKGLPAFLIGGRAGVQSGLMGLQYCASSMAADDAVLAAPASVHSVPTNANNQDVVSMAMVAARQASRVLDNVARTVAIELVCAAQALELRGPAGAGAGTRTVLATIRRHAPPVADDRPLRADVETVAGLIEAGVLDAAIGEPAGG